MISAPGFMSPKMPLATAPRIPVLSMASAIASVVSASVGVGAGEVAGAGFFSLAMLVPLAWAVVLPDVPEVIRRHNARKRWAKGFCPTCRYVIAGATGDACPECGTSRDEPQQFRFGWQTAARFVALALGAWLVGSAAAQAWITLDESRFRAEALASPVVASGRLYSQIGRAHV